MSKHPQWRVGLNLWIDTFDKPWLDLQSHDAIKNTWQEASGWNTKRLDTEGSSHDAPFDRYVFDVHDNDCLLLTRFRNQSFYVIDILPPADYEQWCKHNAQQ